MATRVTAGCARSFKPAGSLAAAAGTTSTSALDTKFRRCSALTRPWACAWSMVSWSALANTSTGAPLAICCSSGPEAAKLSWTLVPVLAASKAGARSLKALVRLAAAETVRSAARAGKACRPRLATQARASASWRDSAGHMGADLESLWRQVYVDWERPGQSPRYRATASPGNRHGVAYTQGLPVRPEERRSARGRPGQAASARPAGLG